MIGMINKANKSKSGKTLSIQVDDVWYSSKNWELEFAAGRRIIFEPSSSLYQGETIKWLNDYVFEDASSTPAAAAMQEAMSAQHLPADGRGDPGTPQPSRTVPNKDSLIGALALTKSITGQQKEQVWEAFVYFYHKMDTFDPTVPFS